MSPVASLATGDIHVTAEEARPRAFVSGRNTEALESEGAYGVSPDDLVPLGCTQACVGAHAVGVREALGKLPAAWG